MIGKEGEYQETHLYESFDGTSIGLSPYIVRKHRGGLQ